MTPSIRVMRNTVQQTEIRGNVPAMPDTSRQEALEIFNKLSRRKMMPMTDAE